MVPQCFCPLAYARGYIPDHNVLNGRVPVAPRVSKGTNGETLAGNSTSLFDKAVMWDTITPGGADPCAISSCQFFS